MSAGVGTGSDGGGERATAEELAGWLMGPFVFVAAGHVEELDAVLRPFMGGADAAPEQPLGLVASAGGPTGPDGDGGSADYR